MNVFVVASLGAIFLIAVTTFIIAFTPLREFIPGYSSTKLKKDATELALKSDSITNLLKQNQAYISSIQKVLTGKLDYAKFNKDSILAASTDTIQKIDLSASEEELELRAEVEKEQKKAQQTAVKKKK
ncbi:peptidase [Flavobacterium flevense]